MTGYPNGEFLTRWGDHNLGSKGADKVEVRFRGNAADEGYQVLWSGNRHNLPMLAFPYKRPHGWPFPTEAWLVTVG